MTYKIVKVPIPKYFNDNSQEALIFHTDLGTYQRTLSTLKGMRSVSYNYYVCRDTDEIIEFVPSNKGAWHSGIKSKMNARAKAFFVNTNPNKRSIGICYEGKPLDKSGKVNWNWGAVVDGQKATDGQVARTKAFIRDRGWEDKIRFAHREITSYKPASVLDFVARVSDGLEETLDHTCTKIVLDSIRQLGIKWEAGKIVVFKKY